MAWLDGYSKRIKLTVDHTKIDSTLTNFPVTVFFTASQGEEIFTEFDADSDYMKCAFTQSDGTTQLYAEKELFSVHKSQYPTAHSDTYVKSTTKYGANYWAYFATDPAKSLTGSWANNSWLSVDGTYTNQRFHIDLGSAKIITRIYYENAHNSGASTDRGVQNFTFWGSNTGAGTFDDLVYGNDEGWTELTVSQNTLDQHTGSDVADPKYITVTNSTAYRYYAFKFADNYLGAGYMGVKHIELQEAKAIYHVKVPSVSSSAGTDIYYYYNNSGSDNTTYIGAINTTAGATVWDSNFKAVYHKVDATTSTIVDSTSNNNDGTKKGANEPIEASAKVGQGQSYDGDDYVNINTVLGEITTPAGTLNAIIKTADSTPAAMSYLIVFAEASANVDILPFRLMTDGKIAAYARASSSTDWVLITDNKVINDDTWHNIVLTHNETEPSIYIDTVKVAQTFTTDTNRTTWWGDMSVDTARLGNRKNAGLGENGFFTGIMDEIRISITTRSAAWIKATYNTLWDTFLTYGSEEIKTEHLAEAFSIADSFLVRTNFAETFSAIDSFISRLALGESFNVIDSVVITGSKTFYVETIHIADSWVAQIQRAEAFAIVDSYRKSIIWIEEVKAAIGWTEETKSEINWTKEDKNVIVWNEEIKGI